MHAAAALLAVLLCGEAPVQIAADDGADRPEAPRPGAWTAGGPRPPQPSAWTASGSLPPRPQPPTAGPPQPSARGAGDAQASDAQASDAIASLPQSDAASEAEAKAPFQLSLEGAGGSRGEGSLQAIAQWRGEGFAIGLGVEGLAGPQITARQGLIAQAEIALAAVALHGEVRVRPAQAGASRSGAEVGARVDGNAGNLDLSLHGVSALAARDPQSHGSLRDAEAAFSAIGVAAEAEATLTGAWAVGLRFSASANQIRWRGHAPLQPWDALGSSLQEWPDRWEAMASLRGTAGAVSVTLSTGAGAPAAAGALAARGALRVEIEAGASTLAAAVGGAHQWPAGLWLAELTLAASLRFGGR
jgi:hypothetical protein